jgi:hypothetical protein
LRERENSSNWVRVTTPGGLSHWFTYWVLWFPAHFTRVMSWALVICPQALCSPYLPVMYCVWLFLWL